MLQTATTHDIEIVDSIFMEACNKNNFPPWPKFKINIGKLSCVMEISSFSFSQFPKWLSYLSFLFGRNSSFILSFFILLSFPFFFSWLTLSILHSARDISFLLFLVLWRRGKLQWNVWFTQIKLLPKCSLKTQVEGMQVKCKMWQIRGNSQNCFVQFLCTIK